MSVDRTIEELNQAIVQLGELVGHINKQLNGVSARLNVTLDNFDMSIAGIAKDAGSMTGEVKKTVLNVPSAWVFYLLLITLIVVLVLTAILIIISLIAKIQEILRRIRGIPSRSSSPLPSYIESDSKQPLAAVGTGRPLPGGIGRPAMISEPFISSSASYQHPHQLPPPSSTVPYRPIPSALAQTTYADEPRRFGQFQMEPSQQQQQPTAPLTTTGYASIGPKSPDSAGRVFQQHQPSRALSGATQISTKVPEIAIQPRERRTPKGFSASVDVIPSGGVGEDPYGREGIGDEQSPSGMAAPSATTTTTTSIYKRRQQSVVQSQQQQQYLQRSGASSSGASSSPHHSPTALSVVPTSQQHYH